LPQNDYIRLFDTRLIDVAFLYALVGHGGLFSKGINIDTTIILWIVVAFAGGLTGAYFGSKNFEFKTPKIILALVLVVASFKLLFVK